MRRKGVLNNQAELFYILLPEKGEFSGIRPFSTNPK